MISQKWATEMRSAVHKKELTQSLKITENEYKGMLDEIEINPSTGTESFYFEFLDGSSGKILRRVLPNEVTWQFIDTGED